ncbi:MAG: F0F1 ATP synthase subunit epsilon [Bacteroidota bacterium]
MPDKTFKLEIVTPQRIVYNGSVVSFTAPGTVGSFQVLHNHAPLLSSIGIGQIKVVDDRGQEARYATSGGFVEVRENHVVTIAETAERADGIDVDRAKAALGRATLRLEEKRSDIDLVRARAAQARAANRLKIAGRE